VKVGINATFLNEKPTGIGIFTKEVSERLCAQQENIVVFTSVTLNADIEKTPAYLRGSIKLSHNLCRLIYTNTVLPLILKKSGIDVLYCPIIEFPFVSLAPLIITVHDLHPVYFPEQFGLSATYFKLCLKLLPRLACRVVVPSNFVKKELLKTIDLDREVAPKNWTVV